MTTTISHSLPTMLGILTKGTFLLLAAALACHLLGRTSAATRHTIWSAALVGVLLLPLLSASLPHWNVAWSRAAASSSATAPATPAPASQTKGSAISATYPTTAGTLADAGGRAAKPVPIPWAAIGLMVWSFGTLFVLARLAIGLLHVERARATAQTLTMKELSLLDEARGQICFRRIEALRANSSVVVPITWGVCCPMVLLPAQSAAWSEECLRAVFLHEMAHIQRRDWATQIMARLACALYWWHPLVWWAARQAREEGERACDDLVLGTGMRPSDYAQQLVEVVRSLPVGTRSCTVAIAMAHPSEVAERVQAVLALGKSRGRVPPRKAAGLMTLIAAYVCLSAVFNPVAATDSPAKPSTDLQGEVIVIDPGHGGQDTGAVGAGGVTEKSLNLAIAQRLRLALERHGAVAFLTRDGDTFPTLMQRPRFAADKHADYLISIHCDDKPSPTYGGPGAIVYYHGSALTEIQLATSIGAGIGQATGASSRVGSDLTRFSPGGFGVLRGASMPAVLVECGDMAIPTDLARLRDPQGQQQIAEGIAAGLSAFRSECRSQSLFQHDAQVSAIANLQSRLAQALVTLEREKALQKSANVALIQATAEIRRGTINDQRFRRTLTTASDAEYHEARAESAVTYLQRELMIVLRQRAFH